MGLFAMGMSALGKSLGCEVNVLSDNPGPQRIMAWKPGEGRVACGMMVLLVRWDTLRWVCLWLALFAPERCVDRSDLVR